MAHIICMTTGLTGILHASFELVHRLAAAGHRVSYACPQDVAQQVQAQQITYFQLSPTNFEPAPALPSEVANRGKIHQLVYKIRQRSQRQRAAMEALGMDSFINFLQEQSPDLLLLDVELHDHIITAVAKNWPVVLISQWFATGQRPGLPPISSTVVPGQSWRGHPLAIRLTWLRQNIRQRIAQQKEKWLSGFTDRRTVLKKWAKDLGFPVTKLNALYWPPPFTYQGLPIWHMTAEGLEFPYAHGPGQAYIGPMVAENRVSTQIDPLITQRLQAIYDARIRDKKQLIYCSVSSMDEGDLGFLQRIIAAFHSQERYILVVGLGGKIQPDQLGALPPHLHAFSWVPQLQVLAQADASINHGGIHTINECIHFAVPMLIYSGKRYDQNGCAARVQYHQVGLVGDKDLDDSERILQNIDQLLENPLYRQKIESLRREYQQSRDKLSQLVQEHLSFTDASHQATANTSL